METIEDVVLVTATFSKFKDLRFELALRTCDAARKAGYKLIIVDDSPDPQIAEAFLRLDAVVHHQVSKGMGGSRREALGHGLESGARVIVWLEPEKYPLMPLLGPAINMVRAGFDIVLLRRRSLGSYPHYQEWSELKMNWELANIVGKTEYDFPFGPRVLSRGGAKFLAEYTAPPEKDNWEIFFLPVLRAMKSGSHSIGSVTVDYVHPPEQTQAEEGNEKMDQKRDLQRMSLIAAMREEAARLGVRPLR